MMDAVTPRTPPHREASTPTRPDAGSRGGDGGGAVYRLVVLLGRVLFAVLRVRVRWRGTEHLPTSGAVVMAANHVSFLDFLFIGWAGLSRGRWTRFLCRHEIWGVRPVGAAMDAMRHVPVDREAPAAAYLRSRALLREGQPVCVFPEAGLSQSLTVRGLMPGAVALARETGAPLVPVVVWGGQRLWPVSLPGQPSLRPRPRWGVRVDVVVGEPLTVAADADLREVTELLGHRLTAMLEEVQRSPEQAPAAGTRPPWHPAHLGGSAPSVAEAAAVAGLPRTAVLPTWGPGAAASAPEGRA